MSERTVSLARERARSRSRGNRGSLKSRGTGLANPDLSRANALQASGEVLQIRTTRVRDGLWVALSGELTVATAPRLAGCLDEALDDDVTPIVVDLSGLRVLAPAAVATLLNAYRRASDDHREFLLIRGSAAVQQFVDRVDGPFLTPADDSRQISIHRACGAKLRSRYVPSGRDPATGTCPKARRGRARRLSTCGTRRRLRG
jgi:anti-anti-sigma factor